MTILLQIFTSLCIKGGFSYLYPKLDVEWYAKKYEDKIQKMISAGWFWNWVFTEWKVTTTKFRIANCGLRIGEVLSAEISTGHTLVPVYRVLHAGVAVVYWTVMWFGFYQYLPWWIVLIEGVSMGIAYYKMTFERLFYTIADQYEAMLKLQREHGDAYWLKRWWFAGSWLFKYEFLIWKFDYSMYIGLLAMVIGSLGYLFLR